MTAATQPQIMEPFAQGTVFLLPVPQANRHKIGLSTIPNKNNILLWRIASTDTIVIRINSRIDSVDLRIMLSNSTAGTAASIAQVRPCFRSGGSHSCTAPRLVVWLNRVSKG